MNYPTDEELDIRKTALIAHMTPAERKAYDIFLDLQEPVYVQELFGPFICDFIGKRRMFILELDGSSHTNTYEYDDKRSRFFLAHGFETYRLYNEDVTEENIQHILDEEPITNPMNIQLILQKAHDNRRR